MATNTKRVQRSKRKASDAPTLVEMEASVKETNPTVEDDIEEPNAKRVDLKLDDVTEEKLKGKLRRQKAAKVEQHDLLLHDSSNEICSV